MPRSKFGVKRVPIDKEIMKMAVDDVVHCRNTPYKAAKFYNISKTTLIRYVAKYKQEQEINLSRYTMGFCVVEGCKSRSDKSTGKSIKFHILPKRPQLRQRWIQAIGRQEHEIPKSGSICSRHFRQDDYTRSRTGITSTLVKDVVPTMNLPNSTSSSISEELWEFSFSGHEIFGNMESDSLLFDNSYSSNSSHNEFNQNQSLPSLNCVSLFNDEPSDSFSRHSLESAAVVKKELTASVENIWEESQDEVKDLNMNEGERFVPSPAHSLSSVESVTSSSSTSTHKKKKRRHCKTCDCHFNRKRELYSHLKRHISQPIIRLEKLPSDHEKLKEYLEAIRSKRSESVSDKDSVEHGSLKLTLKLSGSQNFEVVRTAEKPLPSPSPPVIEVDPEPQKTAELKETTKPKEEPESKEAPEAAVEPTVEPKKTGGIRVLTAQEIKFGPKASHAVHVEPIVDQNLNAVKSEIDENRYFECPTLDGLEQFTEDIEGTDDLLKKLLAGDGQSDYSPPEPDWTSNSSEFISIDSLGSMCPVCHKRFPNAKLLLDHKRESLHDFPTPEPLRRPMQNHMPVRPPPDMQFKPRNLPPNHPHNIGPPKAPSFDQMFSQQNGHGPAPLTGPGSVLRPGFPGFGMPPRYHAMGGPTYPHQHPHSPHLSHHQPRHPQPPHHPSPQQQMMQRRMLPAGYRMPGQNINVNHPAFADRGHEVFRVNGPPLPNFPNIGQQNRPPPLQPNADMMRQPIFLKSRLQRAIRANYSPSSSPSPPVLSQQTAVRPRFLQPPQSQSPHEHPPEKRMKMETETEQPEPVSTPPNRKPGTPVIQSVHSGPLSVQTLQQNRSEITLSLRNKDANKNPTDVANILATRGIIVTKNKPITATSASESPSAGNASAQEAVQKLQLNNAVSIISKKKDETIDLVDENDGTTRVAEAKFLSCPVLSCKEKFLTNEGLNRHTTRCHDIPRPQGEKIVRAYKCKQCAALWSTQDGLLDHQRRSHSRERPEISKERESNERMPSTPRVMKTTPDEIGVPIVDLRNEETKQKLASLGIVNYVPLSLAKNGSGTFGFPIVSVQGASNPSICNLQGLGASGVLSFGPIKMIPSAAGQSNKN